MRKKQKKTSHIGRSLYWTSCVAVLTLAVVLFIRPYTAWGDPKDPGLRVKISMSGWQPEVIHAKAGQPLTITLINLDNQLHADGGGWHDFVLEELGTNERVAPRKKLTFTITPDKPGEYMFYCSICCGGKEDPNMQGKLIVT